MSFRVKVRVKYLKMSLTELIERARRSLPIARPALPNYPDGNAAWVSRCPRCGISFVDPLGRPVTMGFACPSILCPSGFGPARGDPPSPYSTRCRSIQ